MALVDRTALRAKVHRGVRVIAILAETEKVTHLVCNDAAQVVGVTAFFRLFDVVAFLLRRTMRLRRVVACAQIVEGLARIDDDVGFDDFSGRCIGEAQRDGDVVLVAGDLDGYEEDAILTVGFERNASLRLGMEAKARQVLVRNGPLAERLRYLLFGPRTQVVERPIENDGRSILAPALRRAVLGHSGRGTTADHLHPSRLGRREDPAAENGRCGGDEHRAGRSEVAHLSGRSRRTGGIGRAPRGLGHCRRLERSEAWWRRRDADCFGWSRQDIRHRQPRTAPATDP
jgi:hypothetical protein